MMYLTILLACCAAFGLGYYFGRADQKILFVRKGIQAHELIEKCESRIAEANVLLDHKDNQIKRYQGMVNKLACQLNMIKSTIRKPSLN